MKKKYVKTAATLMAALMMVTPMTARADEYWSGNLPVASEGIATDGVAQEGVIYKIKTTG